jgi:ribosome-interacting GTPase 1
MPANLTPDYLAAEQRFREAKTTEEKISALEEMIGLLPKHKGTEKIYADLKARLSKLRKGEEKKGGPTRHGSEYYIKREGVGQVVIVGAPNSGKSALVGALTNALVEVTEYPFATRKPVPGMMQFEDVQFQLVDTPSISADYCDPFLPPFIRNADACILTIDLSASDCLDQPEWVIRALEAQKIELRDAKVSKTQRQSNPRVMPCLVTLTKADSPDAQVAHELLKDVLKDRFKTVLLSVAQKETLALLGRAIFDMFGIIRVYSKKPGKPPEIRTPFVLPEGSTVIEMAGKVHKLLLERFSFARLWRKGGIEGQRVGRTEELKDLDIVEIHTL